MGRETKGRGRQTVTPCLALITIIRQCFAECIFVLLLWLVYAGQGKLAHILCDGWVTLVTEMNFSIVAFGPIRHTLFNLIKQIN